MHTVRTRPSLRSVLRFSAFALALLAAPALTAPLNAQTVSGRLIDSESRLPVSNGTVSLLDTLGIAVARVLTDPEGHFTLRAPGPGRYRLRGSGFGYRGGLEPRFDLERGQDVTTDLFLVPDPVPLEGIEVMSERERQEHFLEVEGFYDRKQMGFGYFITPEEIERRVIHDWHTLFENTPVEATAALAFNKWEMRGRCRDERVKIFVNGMDAGGEVVIYDVLAVEVYAGISSTPLQWTRPGYCGVILIWTKGG
jgi:hypothetical protein